MLKLSVVTSTFNSSDSTREFLQRVSYESEKLVNSDYEIVIIDDGSDEKNFEQIRRITKEFPKVRLHRFSRNFGHHRALLYGLQISRGERVYLTDSDLEEAPEWLALMWKNMDYKKVDSIYAVQETRRGSIYEKFSGWLFYLVMRQLMGINIQKNMMTSRLMNRQFVSAILAMGDYSPNLSGMFSYVGFRQEAVVLTKIRYYESRYTLRKKLDIVIELLTSYSARPLKFIFYFGLVTFFFSGIMSLAIVLFSLFNDFLDGWLSLVLLNLVSIGLIMSSLGMIGMYVSRIHAETKKRPFQFVSWNSDDDE